MKTKYKRFASKMREDLLRQLKMVSAAEGRQIQHLLEEAITEYLDKYKVTEKESADGGVVVQLCMGPPAPNDDNKESG